MQQGLLVAAEGQTGSDRGAQDLLDLPKTSRGASLTPPDQDFA